MLCGIFLQTPLTQTFVKFIHFFIGIMISPTKFGMCFLSCSP